jgi:hypothetical protein
LLKHKHRLARLLAPLPQLLPPQRLLLPQPLLLLLLLLPLALTRKTAPSVTLSLPPLRPKALLLPLLTRLPH